MNPDVTITITTGGDGTNSMGAPGPNPTDVAHAERLAGAPRGPIPTPLDQLPKAASGVLGDASTGDGGPPAPMEIANLPALAANAGGQAPPPVDLDRLAPAAVRGPIRRGPTPTPRRGTPGIAPAARASATRKPAARKPK